MPVIYLGSAFLISTATLSLGKLLSNTFTGKGIINFGFYSLICNLVAIPLFIVLNLIINGYVLLVDKTVVIYAFLFALMILPNYFLTLAVYKYCTIVTYNVIMQCTGLIRAILLGVLLYGETITAMKIIRAVIMIGAVLALIPHHKEKQGDKGVKRTRLTGFLIIVAIFIVGTITLIVQKNFTIYNKEVFNGTNQNSYFIVTNIILVIMSLIMITAGLFIDKKRGLNFVSAIKQNTLKEYVLVVVKTWLDNIGSFTNLLIIGSLDISFFTPISTALGMVSIVIASLIFKEKLSLSRIISLVLCVASILLAFIN